MTKFKVGSLFTGIGGIDIGFEHAGFEISWANDNDFYAGKTYSYNFPHIHLIQKDIRDVNPQTLPEIDILTAGFPCQPFSVMGYQQGFKDPRGNLFFEIARFVDQKKPKVVLLENVKNLAFHDNSKTFSVICKTLTELGYFFKYKIINATEMNIPQDRSRIFIVAFSDKDMCDAFSFPDSVALTKTINDIIDRTSKQKDFYYYTSKDKHYFELNKKIQNQIGIYRIDDSGIAMKKYEICPTLKANMGTYPDRVPIVRDNFGIRKLTLEECLAFQGFPSEFHFNAIPLTSAYKQCGNTVCVPVVESIARKIKNML